MKGRDEIRQEISTTVRSGYMSNPGHKEIKTLMGLNGEIMLQVLDTLDRIDTNQLIISKRLDNVAKVNEETVKTLERINRTQVEQGVTSDSLGRTNNRIQQWMVALTVIILVLTVITVALTAMSVYIALKPQPKPQPTVNNYYQYSYQCTSDPKQVTVKVPLCPTQAAKQQ